MRSPDAYGLKSGRLSIVIQCAVQVGSWPGGLHCSNRHAAAQPIQLHALQDIFLHKVIVRSYSVRLPFKVSISKYAAELHTAYPARNPPSRNLCCWDFPCLGHLLPHMDCSILILTCRSCSNCFDNAIVQVLLIACSRSFSRLSMIPVEAIPAARFNTPTPPLPTSPTRFVNYPATVAILW